MSHVISTYTPHSLVEAVSNAEITLNSKREFCIRGLYRDSGRRYRDSSGRKDRDLFYDRLEDEIKQSYLTIRLVKPLKVKLIDGHPCQLRGFIKYKLTNNDGELGVHLTFEVKETSRFWVEPPLDEQEKKSMYDEVLGARIDNPRKNIDQIIDSAFKRGTPRIALILPDTGVARKDMFKSLNWNSDRRYELSEELINMSTAAGIIQKLRELDEKRHDLIAIVRGGGAGLRVFNDLGIAQTIIGMKTAVVTAIGHEADKPFIEAVADRAFATPTTFGNYLQQVKISARKEAFWRNTEKEEYKQKIQMLEEAREDERIHFNRLAGTVSSLQAELDSKRQTYEALSRRQQGNSLLKAAVSLILGALIGAGGVLTAVYFFNPFHQNRPPVPVVTEQVAAPIGSQQPSESRLTNQTPPNIKNRKKRRQDP